MGDSSRRKRRLFAEQPNCIFCGGAVAATTEDHYPPKSIFQQNIWPKGYSFSACAPCNHGTKEVDLLVAFLSRSDPTDSQGPVAGTRMEDHINAVVDRHMPIVLKMINLSTTEKRQAAREYGLRPARGQTHADLGIVTIPEELHRVLGAFAAKLTKALFFKHARRVFPLGGTLAFSWTTVAEEWRGNTWFSETFSRMPPGPDIARNGVDLQKQFSYRYHLDLDRGIALFCIALRDTLGFTTVATENPADWLEIDQVTGEIPADPRASPFELITFPADLSFLKTG